MLYIPTCGNFPSLRRTLDSIRPLWPRCEVLLNGADIGPVPDLGVRVRRPCTLLNFVATQNWMQSLARSAGLDALLWMHDDGWCVDEATGPDFVAEVERVHASGREWGVLFTNYDVLCAYNTRAVRQVGAWDPAFSHYDADCDWYRRVRLAGYTAANAPGNLGARIHHDISLRVRSDPWYRRAVDATNPAARQYFLRKWGGPPGEEIEDLPFAGVARLEWLASLRDTPAYAALSRAYDSGEGNLLEVTDEHTAKFQVELVAEYLRLCRPEGRPIRVLETGTNKGMFGLLLNALGGGELWTHDADPRTGTVAEMMTTHLERVDLYYTFGDSATTLAWLTGDPAFDLAWIDGGHGYETALSDLGHAMRLQIPWILADDGNLSTVAAAVARALVDHPEYALRPHPLQRHDPRQIQILRRIPPPAGDGVQ